MVTYELSNEQRTYFGLEPVEPSWDRVVLSGDSYRAESILYFDHETIKRHIISTDSQYFEKQYNELTKNRTILLPKTEKGKETNCLCFRAASALRNLFACKLWAPYSWKL